MENINEYVSSNKAITDTILLEDFYKCMKRLLHLKFNDTYILDEIKFIETTHIDKEILFKKFDNFLIKFNKTYQKFGMDQTLEYDLFEEFKICEPYV